MSQELRTAVKERIRAGRTYDEIQAELCEVGYEANEIENAYTSEEENYHEETAPELIGIRALLEQGWQLSLNTVRIFGWFTLLSIVGFGMIGLSVALLFGTGMQALMTGAAGVDITLEPLLILVAALLFILALVLLSVLQFVVYRALLRRDETESVWTNLRWGLRHFFSILILSLFLNFSIQAGMTLLIIPGIALSVYYIFSALLLVDTNERGVGVMIRSIELVYGRWWKVAVRFSVPVVLLLVIVGGVAIAMAASLSGMNFWSMILGVEEIAGGVGGFFVPILLSLLFLIMLMCAGWYLICTTVVLYESLCRSASHQHFTAETRRKLKIGIVISIILGVIFSFVSNFDETDEIQDSIESYSNQELIIEDPGPAHESEIN